MGKTFRIISRSSPLAMWQANHVRKSLLSQHPAVEVEIIGITTQADNFLDSSLASLGGKGAFVKELQQALLDNRADMAVHSMKDVTVEQHPQLSIAVILARENPTDALVCNRYAAIDALPPGSRVGTSSLRRRCQLMAMRPDLEIRDVRGNVGSRLNRLDNVEFDAMILATAGLTRLGLRQRITQEISPGVMLPAIGQGALGIETRRDDIATLELVSGLNDSDTFACVTAERAFNKRLNGGCHAPVAAYATISGGVLTLSALVGSLDGKQILVDNTSGPVAAAGQLGETLGTSLLERGAGKILQEIFGE